MATRASAVDAISPAFEHTKRQLFRPFRFGRWARLAVVAVVTGEFANGGFSGSSNFNFPTATQPGHKFSLLVEPWQENWPELLLRYLPWILVGVVALLCLWTLWYYAESVFRFILFDAVLRGKYEIRAGWRQWRAAGRSYFWWQMAFSSVLLVVMGIVAGVPALLCWRAGIFKSPGDYIGTLIGVGLLVFFALMAVVLLGLLISLLARDFVVPVMAMENVRVLDGWRRLLPMLRGEKGAYAVYVLMKIVLTVGSAILFGILNAIVFLCLAIPVGIVGVLLYVAAKTTGFVWNAYTMTAAGVLGVAALFAIFYVSGFVYAPGLMFFQSYALRFLGARYEKLGAALTEGAGPEAAPAPGAPAGPEPSPGVP